MIGLGRFVVWLSILHVSTQHNISKSNSLAYENNLLSTETRSKGLNPGTSKFFKPKFTEHCEEIGICENVPDYPEVHVAELLKQLKRINHTFYTDVMDEATDKAVRTFQAAETLHLCDWQKQIIAPRAAKDIENEWYFIVNGKNKKQQQFQMEICRNRNSSCAAVITFARPFHGWCHQKFLRRFMTALDHTGKPFQGVFRMPSCCSCVYAAL